MNNLFAKAQASKEKRLRQHFWPYQTSTSFPNQQGMTS